MADLGKHYRSVLRPQLQKELGLSNAHAVPEIKKIVLNVGVGQAARDKARLDAAFATLERISGQKPVLTKSKKAISNFKIRIGMPIGVKVTLRRKKMYDFLEKLISVTLPRVRDFKGLDDNIFDGQGNASIGFSEHLAFPEVPGDEVGAVHGLQVTIQTSAQNTAQAKKLLAQFGFPLKKK